MGGTPAASSPSPPICPSLSPTCSQAPVLQNGFHFLFQEGLREEMAQPPKTLTCRQETATLESCQ